MSMQSSAIDVVAGYRLVRKLGEGTRARVYLGVPESGGGVHPIDAADERQVVLKLFRSGVKRMDIGAELRALAAADLQHCVHLVDLATAEDGRPVPILARVHRGSVTGLFRERDAIAPGEAVTILAPIASTITQLHSRGVVHTNLTLSAIHLDMSGSPVLMGFGHACSFEPGLPPASLDARPEVRAERDRLAQLASGVLQHVRGGSTRSSLDDLRRWLDDTAQARLHEFATELEDRLFDLADPRPIAFAVTPGRGAELPGRIQVDDLHAPPRSRTTTVHNSLGRVRRGYGAHSRARHRDQATKLSREGTVEEQSIKPAPVRRMGVRLVGRVEAALSSSPTSRFRSLVIPAVRSVRKPFWIVTGSILAALILAVTLLPTGDNGTPSTTAAKTVSPVRGEPVVPVGSSGAGPGSRASTSTPKPTAASEDDPVRALDDLMALRSGCFRQRSVSCLDSVDENGASAYSDDVARIAAIRAGGELVPTDSTQAVAPSLLQRLGDSALVRLGSESEPASALLVKEKAGWRIRSFQDHGPVSTNQ